MRTMIFAEFEVNKAFFVQIVTAFIFFSLISTASGFTGYRIGAGDLLSIKVFGEEDLNLENVRVGSNGTISFPLLGVVDVLGITSAGLEKRLTKMLLDGYMKKPKVTVSILEYRMFFVEGEVKEPGGYKYIDGLTVQKGIALAGGFTERAAKKKIKLIQEKNPDEPLYPVDLSTPVNPGDVISIGESFF
ncbi:MAG TPA: polysaccharide export protein [Nitrospirae bacterium]|nr:polysaccharide export protein [Nitrospirota bacterium]